MRPATLAAVAKKLKTAVSLKFKKQINYYISRRLRIRGKNIVKKVKKYFVTKTIVHI